jgi:hypothetical protein
MNVDAGRQKREHHERSRAQAPPPVLLSSHVRWICQSRRQDGQPPTRSASMASRPFLIFGSVWPRLKSRLPTSERAHAPLHGNDRWTPLVRAARSLSRQQLHAYRSAVRALAAVYTDARIEVSTSGEKPWFSGRASRQSQEAAPPGAEALAQATSACPWSSYPRPAAAALRGSHSVRVRFPLPPVP